MGQLRFSAPAVNCTTAAENSSIAATLASTTVIHNSGKLRLSIATSHSDASVRTSHPATHNRKYLLI